MSEKNKSLNPIITRVASIIYNVFDVSEKEAFEMASGKVILADGWGGKEGIDKAVFPQRMEVDYVRVFKRK